MNSLLQIVRAADRLRSKAARETFADSARLSASPRPTTDRHQPVHVDIISAAFHFSPSASVGNVMRSVVSVCPTVSNSAFELCVCSAKYVRLFAATRQTRASHFTEIHRHLRACSWDDGDEDYDDSNSGAPMSSNQLRTFVHCNSASIDLVADE